MGVKQSSEKTQWEFFSDGEFHKFERDFLKVAENTDQRFGKIDIYKNSNNEKYIFGMKQVFYHSQEMTKTQIELSSRGRFSHPNILEIYGCRKQHFQELCGSSNELTIFVEYLENNMEEDIQYRSEQQPKNYYNEYEVWSLLKEIVMGCCFLEERGIHHGDIRPFNIFLTYDNAHAKICDNGQKQQRLLNAIKSNYYKRLCGDIDVYLSPEQLEAFQNKEINPQFDVVKKHKFLTNSNKEKADVYSLGMTLLHTLTLESPLQTVYDKINPYILHGNVDDQLTICRERYSFQLVDLLRQMLMQESLHRLTFKEALAEIIQNCQSLTDFNHHSKPMNIPLPQQTYIPTYQHQILEQPQQPFIKYQSQNPLVFSQQPFLQQSQQPFLQQSQQPFQIQSQQQSLVKYPQGMAYQSNPIQQSQIVPLNQNLLSKLSQFQERSGNYNSNYFYDEKEIDRRVQEAIQKTEQTIRKNQKFQENYGPMIKQFN